MCFYDEGYTFGFRGIGQEVGEGGDPSDYDLNVSFSYMPAQHHNLLADGTFDERLDLLTTGEEELAMQFLSAQAALLKSDCRTASEIIRAVWDVLRAANPSLSGQDLFDHHALYQLSYNQVNAFNPRQQTDAVDFDARREYIQKTHTDGHILTIGRSTLAGLEVEQAAPDSWLLPPTEEQAAAYFTGDVLVDIIGKHAGGIKAARHRVYNHGVPRIAVISCINPDFDRPPLLNSSGGEVDLAKWRDYPVDTFRLNPLTRYVQSRAVAALD